jgi:hypothetical protein
MEVAEYLRLSLVAAILGLLQLDRIGRYLDPPRYPALEPVDPEIMCDKAGQHHRIQ